MFTPSLLHTALVRSTTLEHPVLDGRPRARRGSAPAAIPGAIVIRSAAEPDAQPLAALEQLDGRRLPAGERIVAEADGRLVAAAEVSSGRAIADPFAASAGILELLRVHLDHLRSAQVAR